MWRLLRLPPPHIPCSAVPSQAGAHSIGGLAETGPLGLRRGRRRLPAAPVPVCSAGTEVPLIPDRLPLFWLALKSRRSSDPEVEQGFLAARLG